MPPLQLVDQALRKAGRRPGSLGPRGQPGHRGWLYEPVAPWT